jgi:hypothetical protein
VNIPPLPTDNLYKFIALAGLATALFSYGFAITRISDIDLRLVESRTESDILQLERDALTHDIANPHSRPEDMAQVQSKILELAIKSARLEGRNKQTGVLVSDLKLAWGFLGIGMAGGVLFSFYGFKFWYRRVQAPQDKLIQMQLMREAPAAPGAKKPPG